MTTDTINLRLIIAAVLLAVLATLFSGCQQPIYPPTSPWNLLTKSRRPKRPDPPKPPARRLDERQKLDVQMAMGRSMEKQEQYERAIHVYEGVLQKDDTRADAYHRLAVLHDKKGDGKKASEFYREALRRDGDNAKLHCDLGYSLYLRQKWQEAERHFNRALTLDPNMAKAHNNLALLLARTGRSQAALREFQLGGNTESAARANLAFVSMLDQRFDNAERQFELALAADPKSEAARNGLKTLRKVASAPSAGEPSDSGEKPADGTVQVGFVTASDRRK